MSLESQALTAMRPLSLLKPSSIQTCCMLHRKFTFYQTCYMLDSKFTLISTRKNDQSFQFDSKIILIKHRPLSGCFAEMPADTQTVHFTKSLTRHLLETQWWSPAHWTIQKTSWWSMSPFLAGYFVLIFLCFEFRQRLEPILFLIFYPHQPQFH